MHLSQGCPIFFTVGGRDKKFVFMRAVCVLGMITSHVACYHLNMWIFCSNKFSLNDTRQSATERQMQACVWALLAYYIVY